MDKILRAGLASGLAIYMAACVAQGPALTTASGRPEIFLKGVSPQRVRAAIIDRGMATGWTLDKDSENSISLIKKADNALASILLASEYDVNVMDRLRFTIAGIEGGTKVYLSEEFVTNHGSAFEKTTPLHNNKNSNNLQNILQSLKSRLESSAG